MGQELGCMESREGETGLALYLMAGFGVNSVEYSFPVVCDTLKY